MVTPKLLAQVELTNTFVAVYTAPAGVRAILRNIHLCNVGTPATVQIALIADGESVTNKSYIFKNIALGADQAFSVEAPIVIEPLSMIMITSDSPVSASIFGAEYTAEPLTILHNTLTGIQGGSANEHYHLSLNELNAIKTFLGL